VSRSNGPRPKKSSGPKTKLRKRFRNVAFILIAVVIIIVAGGFVVLRNLVRAPEIPPGRGTPIVSVDSGTDDSYDTIDDTDNVAVVVTEPHPDDDYVGIIVQEPEEEPLPTLVRRENTFTFVLFGHDEGMNTDSIMVAKYDANTNEAFLISIPRDTQVDVSRNVRRINSAYAVGRNRGGGHVGGVDQLKREIATLIGFMPDFYVSVTMQMFVDIIDVLGGVTINVPMRMYYDDPYQDLHIDIERGVQHIDGATALKFARYRLGNEPEYTITDTQRMQNQQQLIRAVADELLSARTITRIPDLIRTYQNHVNTDLSMFELLWFAEQFMRGDITLQTFVYPTDSVRAGRWYEIPRPQDVLDLINSTINPFTEDMISRHLQLSAG